MCGLVGVYSSNMLQKHKEVLSALLYLDTWRGRDSTGVAAIRHNADTCIMKSTVPGYEFVEGPKLFEHLRLNDFCWIGHNRHKTVGGNLKSNAHPFQILDQDGSCILVGAHNGTLKNKHALDDHAKFGTDSEALYNQIASTGLEDAIGKVQGAWALVYYDHVREELRFLRNSERPLYYAFEKGKTTLFWASEIWMLRVATSRFGIELEGDQVRSFAENELYVCPAPEKTNDVLDIQRKGAVVGKPDTTFFPGKTGGETAAQSWRTKKTPQDSQEAGKALESSTKQQNSGETQTLTSRMLLGKQTPESNVIPLMSYKGYKGVPLTLNELNEQLKDGCSWCEIVEIKEGDRYAWLDHDKPVCSKCLDGSHLTENMEKLKKVFN